MKHTRIKKTEQNWISLGVDKDIWDFAIARAKENKHSLNFQLNALLRFSMEYLEEKEIAEQQAIEDLARENGEGVTDHE